MVGVDERARAAPAGERGGDPAGRTGLGGVGVQDVRPALRMSSASARIAAESARSESSRWSAGSLSTSTPSSSATYSIDSSPAASVPATTRTSWPRRAARARAGARAAPRRRRSAARSRARSKAHADASASVRAAAATTPSVSQNIAASGEPPKSAAPASAPRERAEPRGRVRTPRVPGSPSRPSARARRHDRERGQHEEERGADEAELEEHLVVGLLRDEVSSVGREVVGRLVGEALARVRQVLRDTPAGAARPASRCRGRAVEEDAAADVGVDQPLAPAGRVLRPASRAAARTTPAGSRARRCRSASVPAVDEHGDRDGDDDRPAAQVAAPAPARPVAPPRAR